MHYCPVLENGWELEWGREREVTVTVVTGKLLLFLFPFSRSQTPEG